MERDLASSNLLPFNRNFFLLFTLLLWMFADLFIFFLCSQREVIQRDVDRESRLRADTESRLRETASESERYRASLAGLQREFSR